MQDNDLADIERSVQALVRRAYELGRSEVLSRVVGVLKTDQPAAAETLALTGPKHDGARSSLSPAHADDANGPSEDAGDVTHSKETSSNSGPWWARPPR